ncbi:MAG: 1-(5-phosphoribosyl)-5-((5-phosphoribosylamino)methylideneamino)imidazole-4-carboxamide isomerase [Candidatus Omnitrophica bacterium]|nr:1-(5-phosphoribosyl)-5-((5-phosphoribosylamino)methylideneamino)imidazole-4-carboxamide isomerase [Candidatus Omnitrophota bacterium]
MIIIPAIDIIGGRTVRLEKGSYDRELKYDMSPVDAALLWEKAGAELLHVIDLEGARAGKPINKVIAGEIIGKVRIPVQVGGGYRDIGSIRDALAIGARRVIVGSKAIEDLDFAEQAVKIFGDKVIFSVDVSKGKIRISGWERSVGADIGEIFGRLKGIGVTEIIFTDISRDGTLAGPDIEGISEIFHGAGLKFIYAGGIKNVGHISKMRDLSRIGLTGIITGRALYDGTIDLREAISACEKGNTLS